jgi:hypothetical protein
MKHDDLTKLLSEEDFHLDPLGRIVIDNPDILAAINGALSPNRAEDMLLNGGCSNSGCG